MLQNINKFTNIISQKSLRRLSNKLQYFSTKAVQAVADNEDQSYKTELKKLDKISGMIRKERIKKPQKPPFAKNLFVGQFDTEILTYPEITNEELSDLKNACKEATEFSKMNHITESNEFSKIFRQTMADYRLLGLQVPQHMDGRECNISESARLLEIICQSSIRKRIVCNEQLGIQCILKYGSDDIKKKYLPGLMSGEQIAAFCISEESTDNLLDTRAKFTTNKWILNGKKHWVMNGNEADIYIILAASKTSKLDEQHIQKYSIFIIDKNTPGISVKPVENADDFATVTFQNVDIPQENILGKVNEGDVVLKNILSEFRLSYGPLCSSLNRLIINKTMQELLENKAAAYKTFAVQSKLAEMCVNLYATDSMTYLTSGLMDNYENQDCELESSIVKIFSSTAAFTASNTSLELIGMPALNPMHWCNQLHQDAINYIISPESNDNLKLITALLGLQHAGVYLSETIKKLRNPLFNASFMLKRLFQNRRHNADNPKLNLNLHFYLHPSSIIGAKELEYCVLRLQFATEVLLSRHGLEVVDQHTKLRLIADSIIDIYAMIAVLGRASRSYCIGLSNANVEMLMALSYCMQAKRRVQKNILDIQYVDADTIDDHHRIISKKLLKYKQYFAEHALERNY